MSEKKWTAGPWVPAGCVVYGADGDSVADLSLNGRRHPDVTEANTRLTSAAPEMYEACQAALAYDAAIQRYAAHGKQWVQGDDLDALYKDWLAKSLMAIEKASGLSVDDRVQAAIDNVLD